MGALRNLATGALVRLPVRLAVGRSRGCALTCPSGFVSSLHAELRWSSPRWQVRDLASRNGTFCDGVRIPPRVWMPLSEGTTVAFGRPQDAWRLESGLPPEVFAVSEGETVFGTRGILQIPVGEPAVTVYEGQGGAWLVESSTATAPVVDGSVINVGSRDWTLHLPIPTHQTEEAPGAGLALSEIALEFRFSLDEEEIVIVARGPQRTAEIASRAHSYLLLFLARARLADFEGRGESTAENGWRDATEVARLLRLRKKTLDLHVHRARRQFAEAGIVEAAGVVQRRSAGSQLRLGVGRLKLTGAS